MEKEQIKITIKAEVGEVADDNRLYDERTITVEAVRGELVKKLDEICGDIEGSFDH